MRKKLLTIALAAFVAGCASTPPPPPTLDLPAATAGDLKLERWWTAFGDPTLDRLVDDPDPEVRKNVRWAMQRMSPGSAAAR